MGMHLPAGIRRPSVAGSLYLTAIAALLLYSYTQVDLGLTLSGNGAVSTVQKLFQSVGYFNRPLSTALYCAILALLFVLYGIILYRARKGYETVRSAGVVVAATAVILVISYPAFSYDLFNYLFTAKTVLVYHQDPYRIVPLAFNGIDPYLAFMHWTHLPSAYSPVWIAMTLPVYLLSGGILLVSIWELKALMAVAYLAASWGVWKSTARHPNNERVFALLAFALNPLVVIESLVSSHNDIVMMAFAAVAVAYAGRGKLMSWVHLALSAATKTMTVFLIPAYFLGWNRWLMVGGMLLSFVLVQFQREVLPWYWLWVMPFIAMMPDKPWMTVAAGGVSLGLLLRYAPFLYYGNWDAPVPAIKPWVTLVPVILAAALGWIVSRRTSRR